MAKVEKALTKKKEKASAPKPKKKIVASQQKILILDDEIRIYAGLERALKNQGYEVKAVHSVAEGLEEAVVFRPTVIVTRFLLEGMNSDRLVSLLRGMPSVKKIPVIVYADKVLGWEEESLKKVGVKFIGEMNEDKLLDEIEKVLSD